MKQNTKRRMDVKKKAQDNVPENTPETASEQEVVQETQEVQKEQKEQEPTAEEKLQKQIDELNDKLLRTLAEYDNYRKRSIKEKDAIYPQAKADTVEKFLPIIDNFERAMQTECSDEAFKKGIEMIFQSFIKTMTDLSVEEIGKEGETFNPDLHNAVMHVEDENYGENVVAQVLQKGYKIGDRVVRYAMVKVAN
ncbi:MAG: nucleotide exchange factor GrpE [Negativibacillus massiliensis]|uniref:nucleotide exchange factor GrpE n=1 Tax=Negativibacillus massiliensis TaxID=1871035 RepID=UPI002287334A|nr:nucleotide exchange factor GrpE [Negativibacillus massiliensis]MDY4047105.1 nucleotide exchange factor GrpE [Negativibacillus massiliensis]